MLGLSCWYGWWVLVGLGVVGLVSREGMVMLEKRSGWKDFVFCVVEECGERPRRVWRAHGITVP